MNGHALLLVTLQLTRRRHQRYWDENFGKYSENLSALVNIVLTPPPHLIYTYFLDAPGNDELAFGHLRDRVRYAVAVVCP